MRSVAQLFGTLALVGLVCKYWWLIALVLAAVVLWTHIPGCGLGIKLRWPRSSADSR